MGANPLGAVESGISIVLLLALIYVIIEVAEAVPAADFETQIDDRAEDVVGGLWDGGSA
ncbi:hypothetical protein [Halocalculus aciditolerans]|uniref:Uncharacterized protein n=1 Tax=Halocalculus aciditolerans TaxID=1383812 RepID=A0A830FB95_9EURY|nr:hypothetical protein [Halocalculus aciditolerans]GGL57978.1 hypothetical protein GCM10009039_15210 [Halocalculus aciditolerans]